MKVTRPEHIRNDEIRRHINKAQIIIEDINMRSLIWYGHVNRMKNERRSRWIIYCKTQEHKRSRPPKTCAKTNPGRNFKKRLDGVIQLDG